MQQLRNWLYSIAISVPLILLLTNFVGRILANRILQPVYEITDHGQTDNTTGFECQDQELNILAAEMGSLIESFNEMIARLEKSFKHIEQFSYHVAHELKTPLTIIQGEAESFIAQRTFHLRISAGFKDRYGRIQTCPAEQSMICYY